MTEIFVTYILPILMTVGTICGVVAAVRYFVKSKVEIARAAKRAAEEVLAEIGGEIRTRIDPIAEKHLELFNRKADNMTEATACLIRMMEIFASMYDTSQLNDDNKRAEMRELAEKAICLCVSEQSTITYVLKPKSQEKKVVRKGG